MKPQEAIGIMKMFTTDEFQRYTSSEFDDAVHTAIEALEKQIPKKPILRRQMGLFTIYLFHCPVCDDVLISEWNKNIANPYCHHCGQAIDWSEEE